MKTSREFYGVGVEWAEQLENDILSNLDRISCFEFIPENFFQGRGERYLKAIGDSGIPVLVHGVELSLGTAGPLKQSHLDQILRVADEVNMINLSDHLAMTEAGGVEIGQLLFVGAVLAVIAAGWRLGQRLRWSQPAWMWRIPPYAIGALASVWLVERIAAF